MDEHEAASKGFEYRAEVLAEGNDRALLEQMKNLTKED
jgi:hypothetical protein